MKTNAVQITRYFFYLLAVFWMAVGIGYLGQNDGRLIFYIIAGLMFASIFVFIALGANITKKSIYWTGIISLIVCIVLTIFDQFGIADFVALILFIIPLFIMLVKRNEFFQEI